MLLAIADLGPKLLLSAIVLPMAFFWGYSYHRMIQTGIATFYGAKTHRQKDPITYWMVMGYNSAEAALVAIGLPLVLLKLWMR